MWIVGGIDDVGVNQSTTVSGTAEKVWRLSPVALGSIILLVLLVAVGGYFVASRYLPAGAGKSEKPEKKAAELGPTFNFEPFIVNAAGTNGERYLKISLSVELTGSKGLKEIAAKQVVMRDVILGILSNKTILDLEGSGKRAELKKEIAYALSRHLSEGQVVNVYFTEFVLQ